MGDSGVLPQIAAHHASQTAGQEKETAPARAYADDNGVLLKGAHLRKGGQCSPHMVRRHGLKPLVRAALMAVMA